jgi:hypothetical protein
MVSPHCPGARGGHRFVSPPTTALVGRAAALVRRYPRPGWRASEETGPWLGRPSRMGPLTASLRAKIGPLAILVFRLIFEFF